MPSLFYLYTFIYLANKIYLFIKRIFLKTKEVEFEIDLTNINVSDTLGKVSPLNYIISICNFIWLLVGVFGDHETVLFCLITFIDVIGITSIFSKHDTTADKKYYIITLTIKIAVAIKLIFTHFIIPYNS